MGKLTDKRKASVRKEATQQEMGKLHCGRECGLLSSNLFLFQPPYGRFWGVPTGGMIFLPDGYVEKRDSLFVVLLCLNYSNIKSKSLPNLCERVGSILETGWEWEGEGRGWKLIGKLMRVSDPTAGFASSDTGNEFVL